MDRNLCCDYIFGLFEWVALRKESVDRNPLIILYALEGVLVALRKESVDRNCRNRFCPTCQWRSLSARRAWIEILVVITFSGFSNVALRKESVDRNLDTMQIIIVVV